MDNLGKAPISSERKSSGKMNSTKSGAKTTAVKTETSPTSTRKTMPKKITTPTAVMAPSQIDEEQRRGMIAVAAYLRAEQRGFCGGDPTADWLAAEAEIEQHMKR